MGVGRAVAVSATDVEGATDAVEVAIAVPLGRAVSTIGADELVA